MRISGRATLSSVRLEGHAQSMRFTGDVKSAYAANGSGSGE